MKPNKCNLGHKRPDICTQTLFGLNLDKQPNGTVLVHGDLKKKRVV